MNLTVDRHWVDYFLSFRDFSTLSEIQKGCILFDFEDKFFPLLKERLITVNQIISQMGILTTYGLDSNCCGYQENKKKLFLLIGQVVIKNKNWKKVRSVITLHNSLINYYLQEKKSKNIKGSITVLYNKRFLRHVFQYL
jgi:hypothetical protein